MESFVKMVQSNILVQAVLFLALGQIGRAHV